MSQKQPTRQVTTVFTYEMLDEMQELADREFGGKVSRMIREAVALMLLTHGGSDWTEAARPMKQGRPFGPKKKT